MTEERNILLDLANMLNRPLDNQTTLEHYILLSERADLFLRGRPSAPQFSNAQRINDTTKDDWDAAK